MSLFKDIGGKMRLEYHAKMTRAESTYENHVAILASLERNQAKVIVGSQMWHDIDMKINEHTRLRDHYLAEFHAYAAALTAVSTVLLTK